MASIVPQRGILYKFMQNEPITDIAHLGHLEMFTPKPEESLRFFTDIMGMTESGREGDSVYLRAWDDYERHTLKLTALSRLEWATWDCARAAAGSGTEGRGAAGNRARHRMERRLCATVLHSMPGSGRSQDRTVLRNPMV